MRPRTAPGDRRAVRIFGDRDLQPVIAANVHRRAHGGAESGAHARVVALPCARQTHVAEAALHVAEGERSAAIGHVMPHQAAGFRHVHRLG